MTSYAIVIGIDLHAGLDLNPLMGAAADAADFAEWALDPAGGGVAPERLFFWSHPAPKTEPGSRMDAWLKTKTQWPKPRTFNTQKPVFYEPDMARAPREGELRELVLLLQNETYDAYMGNQKTRCYVFLAGHGVEIETKTCFLMGDYEWGRGIISCDELADALQFRRCTEVVMFLDCCRTTLNFDEVLPRTFKLDPLPRTVAGIGRATTRGEPSWEFPADNPTRGAFTHALTEGLRGIRSNNRLTFQQLETYVHARIPAFLEKGRGQVPDFAVIPNNPAQPLVLAVGPGNPIERDIIFTFRPELHGQYFQLSDDEGRDIGLPILACPNEVRVTVAIGRRYIIKGRLVEHFGPEDKHVEL